MQKPKVSRSKIEQVVDLEALTGLDLSDARAFKESIGQAMIDRMIERTESGTSLTGGKLRSPYSKQYQQTIEFKAAGKSASNINMKLTGDMLGSLDLEAEGPGVRLFVSEDQVDKAHGHLTGKDGQVPKMKRNWFGITQKEVDKLLEDFAEDLAIIRERQTTDDEPGLPERIRALDLFNDGDGGDSDD